jgi:plasmid stabilization system protein ParE
MRVRWSQSALTEIQEIFSYIHERNHSAAVTVVERIEAVVDLLEEFPEAGHLTDEPNVRMFPVIRYPYLVFYAIDAAADEVVILHVRHGAQQRP